MSARTVSSPLLVLARQVAAEAAASIASSRPAGRVGVSATKSSATDAVTEIDTATERLIRDRILAVRPDDGFIGEEGGTQGGASGVTWVIDPIDGTVNFIYGIPAYAVSIGVQVEGEVVAGVVLNAATGEEFGAEIGQGSWLRDRPGRTRWPCTSSTATPCRTLSSAPGSATRRGAGRLRRRPSPR